MADDLKIICSYCQRDCGEKEPLTDTDISHTICPECLKHFRAQWAGMDFSKYLERFPFPVLIVDGDGRGIAANQILADALGKPRRELTGLLGGNVMECEFARLPGGCGRTVHCDVCTVRNAVMRTHATGEGEVRTPAFVQRSDGRVDLAITTEKIGDAVAITIEEMGGESTRQSIG